MTSSVPDAATSLDDVRLDFAKKDPKLTGRHKQTIIRALAAGYPRRSALARQYGVGAPAITLFAKRFAREIQEQKDKLDDEFASLWIANKSRRIAELEEIYDILEEADDGSPDYSRAKLQVLKQASEELGQLPPRQQVLSARVTHTLEGFTNEDIANLLT